MAGVLLQACTQKEPFAGEGVRLPACLPASAASADLLRVLFRKH